MIISGNRLGRNAVEGPRGHGHAIIASIMVVLTGLWLAACQAPTQQHAPPDTSRPSSVMEEVVGIEPGEEARRERHRRRIADWLYEGLRAMREDRLMVPPDESAHAWFSRVLALEPDNELAMEGLRDIAARYVELAGLSARQGQFDNAEQFLRRAALVDPDHPRLEAGRDRLALERQRTHSVHELNARAVAQRDAAALAPALSRIEERLAGNMDTLYLLITAPTDGQGRWIYGLMRERLGVQRLPGDIEIGGQPSIRLVNRG